MWKIAAFAIIEGVPISREEALALVGQLQDATGRRDIARLMEFYAEDAMAISPVFGEIKGREAIAATFTRMFSTLADVAFEVSDVLVDGDRIAILGIVKTTDRRGWFGLPATGGPIEYRLVLLLTIAQGKIIQDERIYDSSGVVARVEKARLDKELDTAAEVQRALLSRTAHVGRFCESLGDSVPCRAIGGDFFEFIDLPSGSVGIAIGDIAGKGPAAALLAALLQGMFATEVTLGGGPAEILSRMNGRLLERGLESRFATLVYAEFTADGRLVYSNAGHNPPALLARDGIRRLTEGGPILGAFPSAAFEEETLRLQHGDTLVMFTDGAIEARNVQDEEFGEDGLMERLVDGASSTPKELLRQIIDGVRDFCKQAEQSDDITVTVTRFR